MRYYELDKNGDILGSTFNAPIGREFLLLPDAPNQYSRWNGVEWIDSPVAKAMIEKEQMDADREIMIQQKMREMAIAELKKEGKIKTT